MIGVVIPAHNEESYIEQCLRSVKKAAEHPSLNGRPVIILVVLDACTDRTCELSEALGASVLHAEFNNVGKSRGEGANRLLKLGSTWLAFTDADTVVPYDWLTCQVACEADAVCGVVNVDSWDGYGDRVREHYMSLYKFEDDHRHVHGANFGVSAKAYLRAGGFQPLSSHEDVQLVADLESVGARIVWTASNPVTTSARCDFKCREGFGEYLNNLAIALCATHYLSPQSGEGELPAIEP